MIDLASLTIQKAHDSLKAGEFTCRELAEAYLKVIKEKNRELNAYLEVFDDVLEQAEEADKKFADGSAGLMTGIPIAIKDNILFKGHRASSGSKILENYVATYDATVIEKLKQAGAVILGRTNMDEFALGGSTENSAYGPTKNPHDTKRVPGGTSGGSAASVAALMCLAALGSDTGGSIRLPSSFCGVIGMKPTYGRVSRSGLMAATSSFDVIGPITKTVEDARILFREIYGADALDSTTIRDTTYPPAKKKEVMAIGVPWSLIDQEGIDPQVKENFKEAVKALERGGYRITDIKLPNCIALYYIINFAEVSTNLARFDGVRYGAHKDGKNLLEDYLLSRREGLGKESRRRILLGAYVLSAGYYDAYYGKAQKVRASLRKEFSDLFSTVDLILTPTSPIPAWKIGEKSDPLAMYLVDIFTCTANIVGVPAISVPSGSMNVEGKTLPLGIQFMAPHGGEEALFEVSEKFQRLKGK